MDDWKKIHVFMYPQDAYLAKSLLESEEIDVFLQDEMTTQIFNFYSNAIGGVKILVPTKDADRAIEVLKDGGYIQQVENATEEIETLTLVNDTDKEHCPYCESENIRPEKKPNFITIGIILIFGFVLPISSKTYVCFGCGKKWKWRKSNAKIQGQEEY